MSCKKLHRLALSILALIFFGSLSSYASAEIIDDITVHTDPNGDVEAVVKFTVPIQYLRHFPQGKSPATSIYFNILGSVPADEWQDYETHRTPPSDVVQDITVSTRDLGTGPKILIKFYRPAEFSVRMGSNNQVLLIHVKPGAPQQKNESKPAAGTSGGASIPLAAVPLAVLPIPKPSIVSTPSVVAPTVSTAKDKPLAAVVPAPVAPVAPVAPAPVAPSGDVTSPKVVLAQSQLKPVHIALGGKDGLPPFPDIDQVGPQGNVPLSDKASLAERITKANNQAATLMVSGGNALLSGQTFDAVESFNKVLNLPPNKYTQDAQLWIAIARERLGQHAKAMLEFNTYLKLYPDGKMAMWVKERLDRLKTSQPALFIAAPPPVIVPVKVKNTEFQYSEFGSLSMYYYTGASQTNTTATVGAGATQAPTSLSRTDQKSLMTNVNMTARSFNNEYDNRLVIQDFYAANFLAGQQNSNRLGAAYYEMKDRIENYSFKVGRQSGFGGGVMGRFDGILAGYGASQNWKANFVTGQLSDVSIDAKPKFNGVSLDFGLRNPLGGSVYFINQTVSGITDRRALGGNLRYFDQRFNIMSMLDYDVQFKALNMFTLQGTLLGGGTGTDYNFLVDRRRSPVLDVRNAVNGTTSSVGTLLQNGWSISDLILLADQRTTVSTTAQVGMTNHLNEKWLVGTDFSVAKTGALAASGTINVDPVTGAVTTGLEGFVAATPSTGNTWTISERMTGMGVIRARDITNFSLSFTKGQLNKVESVQVSNHVDLQEKWTLDSSMRLSLQSDNTGGKSNDLSPTFRLAYRVRNNLTADGQLGLDWNKTSTNILQPNSTPVQSSSTAFREFISFGFQLSF